MFFLWVAFDSVVIQIVDLDSRRNRNREAMNALKSSTNGEFINSNNIRNEHAEKTHRYP